MNKSRTFDRFSNLRDVNVANIKHEDIPIWSSKAGAFIPFGIKEYIKQQIEDNNKTLSIPNSPSEEIPISSDGLWSLVNETNELGVNITKAKINYPICVDVPGGFMQVGTKLWVEDIDNNAWCARSSEIDTVNNRYKDINVYATGDNAAYGYKQEEPDDPGFIDVNVSGDGNAFTSMTFSGGILYAYKGETFATYAQLNSHINSNIHVSSSDRSNWDSAYSNSHWHSNKSYLDNINQNLSTSSNVQHNRVVSTTDVVAYYTGSYTNVFPIATTTSVGCIKVGSGLSITADGTLSSTGGGTSGITSVSVTGSGNVITGASVSGTVLNLTKGLNAQPMLTAGANITISNNVISASGGSSSNSPIEYFTYYGGTTSGGQSITSGLRIRSGYIDIPTGSLAAGDFGSTTLWDISSSAIACVASVRSNSSSSFGGRQLVVNTALVDNQYWRLTWYNPTSSSISLSNVRVYYIAIV